MVRDCSLRRKSHALTVSQDAMRPTGLGKGSCFLPQVSIAAIPEGSVLFLVPLFILFCGRDLPSPTYTGIKSGGIMAHQISRVSVKARDIYEATIEFHAYIF